MSKRQKKDDFLESLFEQSILPELKKRKRSPVRINPKKRKRDSDEEIPEEPIPKKKYYPSAQVPPSAQPMEEEDLDPSDVEEEPQTEEDRVELFRRKLRRTAEALKMLYENTNEIISLVSPNTEEVVIPTSYLTILRKLKNDYEILSENFKGDIRKALMIFKTFWGEEDSEEVDTISSRDNFQKLYKYMNRFARNMEFKLKQEAGKAMRRVQDYTDLLVAFQDKVKKTKGSEAIVKTIDKKIESAKALLNPISGLKNVSLEEASALIHSLLNTEWRIFTSMAGLNRVFRQTAKLFFRMDYVFIEKSISGNYVYQVTGKYGFTYLDKETVVFCKSAPAKPRVNCPMFSYSIVDEIMQRGEYSNLISFMREYINTYDIFKKIDDDRLKELPLDVIDQSQKDDPTSNRPLTIAEILYIANYQFPIEGEALYSEAFYSNYKRRLDSVQTIEPGVEVVIMGTNECPVMELNMAVTARKSVSKEELEVAKDTMGMVKGYIDYAHNGNLLIIDMAKAPKNHYITFLKKHDSYYHKVFQWFITINPNMTSNLMSVSVREGLINTKEEFYELTKIVFSSYIPEWLTYNKRPLEPEYVRSWKIEEMREENGGGPGALGHIHLLLTVSVIHPEDIDSKSLNLSYGEVNKFFQTIRKQTYFNCQKVSVDTKGMLDKGQSNKQRVLDYITKGERAPPKYSFSKFKKPNSSPEQTV